jgi:hypothetical protein
MIRLMSYDQRRWAAGRLCGQDGYNGQIRQRRRAKVKKKLGASDVPNTHWRTERPGARQPFGHMSRQRPQRASVDYLRIAPRNNASTGNADDMPKPKTGAIRSDTFTFKLLPSCHLETHDFSSSGSSRDEGTSSVRLFRCSRMLKVFDSASSGEYRRENLRPSISSCHQLSIFCLIRPNEFCW